MRAVPTQPVGIPLSIVDQPSPGRKCRFWPASTIRNFPKLPMLVSIWLGTTLTPTCLAGQPGPIHHTDGNTQVLDGQDGRPLALNQFRPESMLQVPRTLLTKARFPVVDVHTHFGYRLRGSQQQRDDFVELMDRNNIAICVSLDGKLGESWAEHADFLWQKYPERFVIFVHIDWQGDGAKDKPETWDCNRPGFARRVARQLVAARQKGASGLKIFKKLGLSYKNSDGTFVQIDDPRWDPIWTACGELGMPVIIHTADPKAFFRPADATNERWEELSRHPDWAFSDTRFPSRGELITARNRVIERHPKTNFIGAHVANNSEDLEDVSNWLKTYPNLYVELASRIAELGRQPYTARKFFLNHSDRILFGTDGPWPEARLRLYWRFLETYDEYFPYSEKEFPPQGFWNIYGIGLPDEILRKVYYENAQKLLPDVREKLAPTKTR